MKNFRLFYCPNCGKEKIKDNDPYKNEHTIVNIRGGYGRVIRHYKCECGNYLAGMINIDENDDILYYKEIIKMYNDEKELLEKAKFCYENRKNNS